MLPRRPFRHEARSPRVRTHSFTAQPPDIHRLALATRASRLLARSPCLAVPRIRFLFIGSRFTLHASSPRSVALPQLRFTSFAVASSREDLHLQECARAGRTKKPQHFCWGFVLAEREGFEPSILSRRKIHLSACFIYIFSHKFPENKFRETLNKSQNQR